MKLLETLNKLGFTEYESKIYLTLVKNGPLNVTEISKISKVPRTKIYEILEKLELKDTISKSNTSPKIFTANHPSFLKDRINKLNIELDDMIEIYEKPKQREIEDSFWIIKGRNAIIKKLYQTHLSAKKEILACTELNKMTYENQRIIKDKIKEGIKVKFITNFNKEHKEIYKVWKDLGVKIRVYDNEKYGHMLPRITIQDSKISRFTLGKPEMKDESEYVAFWNESETFSFMLKQYFKTIWNESKDIENFL